VYLAKDIHNGKECASKQEFCLLFWTRHQQQKISTLSSEREPPRL
jgi:hypothetical protein